MTALPLQSKYKTFSGDEAVELQFRTFVATISIGCDIHAGGSIVGGECEEFCWHFRADGLAGTPP